MRAFEDYCWRDILTDDLTRVYSAYHRERSVKRGSAVLVVHPSRNFDAAIQADWSKAALRLVEEARAQGLTVLHSVPPGAEPDPAVEPTPTEPVCSRPCDSAFFFSNLEGVLVRTRAKGIVICGAPTSGAVRATAVDAKSFGHKTAIAEEATGDEASLLHKVALFDMAHKYADVMSLDEVLSELRKFSNTR
jgi:nicotinamidase-related amidase